MMFDEGIQGSVDTSFMTQRRDMFSSGIVAEIGPNAFVVWSAIRCLADFNTGKSFPGMRAIGLKTGLSAATVKRAIDVLEANHLVRVVAPAATGYTGKAKRGQTYIACDKLTVRLGELVLCTILIDYVPVRMTEIYRKLDSAFLKGKLDPDLVTTIQIVPGPGFAWDPAAKRLVNNAVPVNAIPRNQNPVKHNIDQMLLMLKGGAN